MAYRHEPLSQRSSSDFAQDTLLEKDSCYIPPSRRTWRQRMPSLLLHATLIAIYTVICVTVVWRSTSQVAEYKSHRIDTPARSVLQDVEIVFDHHVSASKKYFGSPSEEVDQAWNDILDYQNFKFSKEEMARYGRAHEGAALTDGTGYMGTFNVFHEMHCLKRIYMYIYKDEYYGSLNLSDHDQMMNLHHTMHCLENIRQGVQCRADSTPVTYLWGQNQKVPLANFTGLHECKNWNVFMDWAKEESFDPFQPGLVVHPTYGPAYEDDNTVDKKLAITDDKPLEAK